MLHCNDAKHTIKTAVAVWVPEKLVFQIIFFNADVKKQVKELNFSLKADATAKLATAKFSRKPNPEVPNDKTTAIWEYRGEAKLHVFE